MIYLDSAATTLQKPARVARAACCAIGTMASPGRGGHQYSMAAAKTAFACRAAAAKLFHAARAEDVALTFNATHGLNIAIRSAVKPGDTALISGFEHNAVTRPLYAVGGVTVKTAVSPLFAPEALLDSFRRQLTPDVRAVICTHVSNVFGYILPVREIGALCRERGVPFILDASQSAGCLPVHMDELDATFIAMPGHKGLYGPQGTGLLICGGAAEPLLYGGTGSNSRLQEMPDFLPDRLEAGTHNIPGLAGLLAGLQYVQKTGLKTILEHEQALICRAARGLKKIPGVIVYADENMKNQAGVLSFRMEETDCEEAAAALARMGVAVRAGLHCAPLAHDTAGTLESGTVRISVSSFSAACEIDRFLAAVAQLRRRKIRAGA